MARCGLLCVLIENYKELWQNIPMKKFIYFILQIFAFMVFVSLSGLLPPYFIEPINSLDWSQIEILENNQEIYNKIGGTLAYFLTSLFIVKLVVSLIRIIKGNEKVWIWRYAIRATLALLIIAVIPQTVYEVKSSQINNLKTKTAEDISQKIIQFVDDNPNDFIFYSNSYYDKNYEVFVSPNKISRDAETFEDYLKIYPPESHEGIKRTDQLFNPQTQNYICESSATKFDSEITAIYKKNTRSSTLRPRYDQVNFVTVPNLMETTVDHATRNSA